MDIQVQCFAATNEFLSLLSLKSDWLRVLEKQDCYVQSHESTLLFAGWTNYVLHTLQTAT